MSDALLAKKEVVVVEVGGLGVKRSTTVERLPDSENDEVEEGVGGTTGNVNKDGVCAALLLLMIGSLLTLETKLNTKFTIIQSFVDDISQPLQSQFHSASSI